MAFKKKILKRNDLFLKRIRPEILYTYKKFITMQDKKRKWQKSEMKAFLFKKYIYCVVKYMFSQ